MTDGPNDPAATGASVEPEGDGPELDQIRVFLLRRDIAVPEGAIRESEIGSLATTEIASHGLRGLLVIAPVRESVPGWLPFLRDLARTEIEYPGNRHLSAVLFVWRDVRDEEGNVEERAFALTFGFGRHLLAPEALEPEFGLRTAAGLVDPNAIASVDSRAFEATILQVRRQSSRGTGTRAIGFDVGREMLRALAGELIDANLGTRVTGSDSLGLTATLAAEELGKRLDDLHAAFAERRYRGSFGYLDRWHQLKARDPERAELDAELEAVLQRRREVLLAGASPDDLAGPQTPPMLMAPQVIEYSSAGFVTNVEGKGATPHPFPDLDAYLVATQRPPTLNDLRRNHDLLLWAGEPFGIEEVWPVYSALTWQLDRAGETYVLVEGVWWRIDAAYRARIDERLADIPESTIDLPPFDPIEYEGDYNQRAARSHPAEWALIDRQIAKFEDEEGGVEPCDLLTADGEFVHVKRMTGSEAMSHMLGQGLVSARLFSVSKEFRDYLRERAAAWPSVVARIPEGKPQTRDYTVIYGIVSRDAPDADGVWPHVALSLPFFSRNFLYHVATEIEGLGYSLAMRRIPVVPNSRTDADGLVERAVDGLNPPPTRWASRPRRRRRAKNASEAPTGG